MPHPPTLALCFPGVYLLPGSQGSMKASPGESEPTWGVWLELWGKRTSLIFLEDLSLCSLSLAVGGSLELGGCPVTTAENLRMEFSRRRPEVCVGKRQREEGS